MADGTLTVRIIGETVMVNRALLAEFSMTVLFEVRRTAVILSFQFPCDSGLPRIPPILNSTCSEPEELCGVMMQNAASVG